MSSSTTFDSTLYSHLSTLLSILQLKSVLDEEPALANSVDRNGKSLLHIAVERNKEDLVSVRICGGPRNGF
jgi:ankyrin repeat protein